jgi:phosphoserine phosphatase RsbU/P
MIPFSKTIGFRLLIVSFFLLALPIVVHSFILIYQRHQSDVVEAKTFLRESAYLRELPLSKVQPIREGLIDTLYLFFNLEKGFPEPSEKLNDQLKELSKKVELEDVVLLKMEGDQLVPIASGNGRSKEVDFSKLQYSPSLFSPGAMERGFTEYLVFTPPELSPKFIIGRGITNNVGDPLGAIVVLDDASTLLQDVIKPDFTNIPIEFAITLPSSIILASSDPKLQFHYFENPSKEETDQFQSLFTKPVDLPEKKLVTRPVEGPFWEFDWNGKSRVAVTINIPGTAYQLVAYALYNDIYRNPFHTFSWVYASYLIILLAGVTIVYLITKRMMRPVQELCQVMKRVKEGDLHARYRKLRFGMQINQLGEQFNEMMQLLLNKQESVEKERIEREKNATQLQMGQEVQRSLLETESEVPPEIDLSFHYLPAKDVGGDFYDYIQRKDGDVVLTIADASGKGLNACCYSLMLKSILRTLSVNESMLGAVMRKGNNLFIRDTGVSGMFVTVQMVWLNPKTGNLRHLSFGHNPGFIVSPDGTHRDLKQTEMAMGVLDKEERIDAFKEVLEPGEVIILYSDGVSEAHNEQKELFGMERLIGSAVEHRSKSALEIGKGILSAVDKFVGEAQQHDDITLVVLKKRAS